MQIWLISHTKYILIPLRFIYDMKGLILIPMSGTESTKQHQRKLGINSEKMFQHFANKTVCFCDLIYPSFVCSFKHSVHKFRQIKVLRLQNVRKKSNEKYHPTWPIGFARTPDLFCCFPRLFLRKSFPTPVIGANFSALKLANAVAQPTLKLTASSHLKIRRAPKGNEKVRYSNRPSIFRCFNSLDKLQGRYLSH